jgi:tRNA-specific 2-thiouridylase
VDVERFMSEKPTAVAMSGGVDSSVAACMLARDGRRVVGFSMQLVDRLAGEENRYGRCCSPDDFRDARRVADHFGFPHYVVDMEDDFRRLVIQPFADDYASGRTPSPCVRCNTYLKFGVLVGRARAAGADRVATGHYAVLETDPRSGRTLLRQAVDLEKDQSYFLFDLTDEQRRRAEFPLGHFSKDEVRALAHEMGLVTAAKPESMDLCFVAEGESYRHFLDRNGLNPEESPGTVVDRDGQVLGRHSGVGHFTVGQRRGIGVSSDRRLYVLSVEPDSRRVVVGDDADLHQDSCVIERTRWIPFEKPGGPVRARVRIRSTHDGAVATITEIGEGRAKVSFDEPQRAITPGQAAVAYDGDLVLGGGWIEAGSRAGSR